MTGQKLYELLTATADRDEARAAALRFLEDTGKDVDGFKRIVDMNTGRWQETFTANGHKYRIIDPEQGITLTRYTQLRAALAVVGRDQTLSEQADQLTRAKGLVESIGKGKDGIVQLSVILEDMVQSIHRGNRKWHFSFWAATLFIIREGEILDTYDETLAGRKIEDWNAEKINAVDLFFCCLMWEKRWNTLLNAFAVHLA